MNLINAVLTHKTAAPVAGSAVSCVTAFDLHQALGLIGQVIGILSGLASIAWVGYQVYQSRKAKK